MKVHELMSAPARTCRPQDSLEKAAQLLWEHDCGMLPVVDGDGSVRAVITDRDICMGAYTRGERLADLKVADSMSHAVATCQPDDDLRTAAQHMVTHGVRRLPVVDDKGKPCGVISMDDLALTGERDVRAGRAAMRVLTASCKRRAREANLSAPPSTQPKSSIEKKNAAGVV